MMTIVRSTLLIALLIASGCQNQKPQSSATTADASNQSQSDQDESAKAGDRRYAVAIKAKDDLFAKLSGRLKEVLQAEGAAAAIEVCSQEATEIAKAVGQQHGVQIGRTSHKLRNPANAPRAWVQPLVDRRVDAPQQVPLEDGRLGALFPIRLDVKCLMCHGGPDEILDEVKTKLAERYPNDGATGFKQGGLRGWFWVEVP